MSEPYDVAIIGAGPGGAATAHYLALAGLRVLLLDKFNFPRDKTCGDGLTPRALRILDEMGLLERIRHEGRLTEGQRDELVRAIHDLERRYFAASNGESDNGHADLKEVTEGWLRRVS